VIFLQLEMCLKIQIEAVKARSPRRPMIDSSYRLPVFSGPQDELSKLKEDIMRLSGTFNNVQAMLSNMYQRIEILEEDKAHSILLFTILLNQIILLLHIHFLFQIQ